MLTLREAGNISLAGLRFGIMLSRNGRDQESKSMSEDQI